MAEQALQAAFEIKTACDEISRRLLRWHWEHKPGSHSLGIQLVNCGLILNNSFILITKECTHRMSFCQHLVSGPLYRNSHSVICFTLFHKLQHFIPVMRSIQS